MKSTKNLIKESKNVLVGEATDGKFQSTVNEEKYFDVSDAIEQVAGGIENSGYGIKSIKDPKYRVFLLQDQGWDGMGIHGFEDVDVAKECLAFIKNPKNKVNGAKDVLGLFQKIA